MNEGHLHSPVIGTVLNSLHFGLGELGADISRVLALCIMRGILGGLYNLYKQAVFMQHGRDIPSRLGHC